VGYRQHLLGLFVADVYEHCRDAVAQLLYIVTDEPSMIASTEKDWRKNMTGNQRSTDSTVSLNLNSGVAGASEFSESAAASSLFSLMFLFAASEFSESAITSLILDCYGRYG
jgi:hypothetical protein